jgi:RNA polymerase sigma-70 factor (ECF subfamily)
MPDPADRLYERLLVLRCQTGDETAFAALVEGYSPRLRYYLRKLLDRDADRADDLLQEVWFDVFRGVPRLADPAAFPAWLYRIARDRALRELRKRRPTQRPLVEADLANSTGDVEFSPEDAARIHTALGKLAPEHREVLVLRFLEAMSYEDIAQIVGAQLGTVKSRLYYAKRALRRVLEERSDRE